MKIRASAPGRAGILGNPSDIYGGKVVSISVPARAWCEISDGDSRPDGDHRLWDAAVSRLGLDFPVAVSWGTDVPRSSGLSGSTALLASMVGCLLAVRGEADRVSDPADMAELVRDIERYDAGIICGYQDATMICHGGYQFMDFEGKHPITAGPRPVVDFLEADAPYLLVTTGVERLSGSVHGPMIDRWLQGEKAVVQAMVRIAEIAAAGSMAIEFGDWDEVASCMTENHGLVRDLGGSGEPIEALIEAAMEEGAMAAKLAGAGLGGTVICLTQEPDELQARLSERGYTQFLRPTPVPGLRLDAYEIA